MVKSIFKNFLPLLAIFILSGFLVHSHAHATEKLQFARVESSPIQLKSIELLKIIYGKLGVPIEFITIPGLRSLKMSNDGQLAGEVMRIYDVGVVYQNLIRVPTPLLTFSKYAYTLNGPKVSNLEGLSKSYRIGIQRGVIQSENAVAGRKGVVRANTVSELAHKLSGGSIDVVLGFGRIFETEYTKLNLKGDLVRGAPLEEVVVYHYLHKKNEHLVDKVDMLIKAMTADGSINEITRTLLIN